MNIMTDEIIFGKRKSTAEDAKFSILIPTWNNLDYLKVCINSIRKNSFFRHQVIVHINEGKDGTREWIMDQPDVDYSYSKKNLGICFALNLCRVSATTSYLLYLNDDMYVCPGWDKELSDEIGRIGHPYFFLSSTAIEPVLSGNCAIQKDYGTDIETFNEELLLNEYALLPKSDWAGATWPPNIVHKDIWDLVGGYSIEFSPGMYSDPDFSMKLWKAGIRLFKGVAESRVYHFGSKSVNRVVKNAGYYKFISKWGVTSSNLTKYYLHRGEPYTGLLPEPVIAPYLGFKNIIKRISAALARH